MPNRNLAMDSLKAFLALGVLHNHSINHYAEASIPVNAAIKYFLYQSIVPTFYFVAGLFLYFSLRRIETTKALSSFFVKRFRQLIIPAVIFTLLPGFKHGLELLMRYETAYYFLPVLFINSAVILILAVSIRKLSTNWQTSILLSYGLFTTILMAFIHDLPVGDYLHWRPLLHNNLFLVLGFVVGIHPNVNARLSTSPALVIGCAILYTITYGSITHYPNLFHGSLYAAAYRVLIPTLGMAFYYGTFNLLVRYLTPNSLSGKVISYVGQRSLAMYILQDIAYLIVFSFIDTTDIGHPELMAVCTLVLCSLIALLVHDIICLSPIAERWIFGRSKPVLKHKD